MLVARQEGVLLTCEPAPVTTEVAEPGKTRFRSRGLKPMAPPPEEHEARDAPSDLSDPSDPSASDLLPSGVDYPCVDLVERITDYLEGALGPAEAAAIESHLDVCDGCTRYLAQIRQIIATSAAIADPGRSEELDDAVTAIFRDWHARGRSR